MAASRSSTATDVDGPEELGPRDWLAVAKRTVRRFLDDDGLGLAQQIAFNSLLAFFPGVILVIGLLGLFGDGAFDALVDLLGGVAPGGVLDAIELARESAAGNPAGSAVAFALGAAGALWAASGATGAVIKAVNRAYGHVETRPFWKQRLLALLLVVLMGAVLAGVFLLIVFGGPLGRAIADEARLGGAFDVVWGILRWPIAFAGILLFFAIVYYVAPNARRPHWKWVTPGSLAGSVVWLALSALFSLYTSFSGSYDRTYGSIAGAIILLLWLNYSATALLLGAELNAEVEKQADIRAAGGEKAGLVKPSRRAAST